MSKIVSKLIVTFVFLLLSALPYVGIAFLVLSVLWALWTLLLIVGLVRTIMAEGFTVSEFQDRPE